MESTGRPVGAPAAPAAAGEAERRTGSERARAASPVGRAPGAAPEQVVACVLTACLVAAVDAIVTLARGGGAGASVGGAAAATLIAMAMPVGLVAGLALAGLIGLARSTPWLGAVVHRVSDPRRWWQHDPEGFGVGLGALAGAGALALGAHQAFLVLSTRFHRMELSALAAAGLAIAAVPALVAVVATVAWLVRAAAPTLGRVACVGTVLLLALAAAVAVAATALSRGLVDHLDPATRWAPPVVVLLYALVTFTVRRGLARTSRVTHGRLAAAVAGLAVASAVTAAFAYDGRNATRDLVERRSVLGPSLHRWYSSATDSDGDGHAWGFGGGDCDDGDPSVFPGAIDRRGDGVDADCWGGDGSEIVEDFGAGAYGTRPAGLDRPNVLIVSIDALRPDHLGAFGYERPTSPRLDRFAAEATVFEDAQAPSSRSIRSFPSMFTGLYPSQIAYGPEFLYPALLPENQTLPEELSRAGWDTSVTMGTHYFERTGDFFQGFRAHHELDEWRARPEAVVEHALGELRRMAAGERPFFQWVHLMNVHSPYLRPGPPSRFGSREVDAYDTEILLADAQIGRLLDELDRLDVAGRTIVVVVSDHGEAFGEHGNRYHSKTLYVEELRSVLMIRTPGVGPRRVPERVGLLDLFPTLLNLVDLPVPTPVPARSLVPLMTGEGGLPADRLLYAEILPDGHFPYDQKAIFRGDLKLIWWVREGRVQLFDVRADPREQRDLSDERPEVARELRGLLAAWSSQTSRDSNQTQRVLEAHRLSAPPSHLGRRVDLVFDGTFRLLGYDLRQRSFRPGQHIPVTFYYEVLRRTDRDYRFELDLRSSVELPEHFHAHHYPLNGHYLTTQWRPGELLRDPVEIVIPHDCPRDIDVELLLWIRDREQRMAEAPGHTPPLSLGSVRIE